MSSPRITYTPRPDATPEGELTALAAVYRLILDSKKAAPESRPDDMRKDQDAHTATKQYTS
jgi:hypothetical protein